MGEGLVRGKLSAHSRISTNFSERFSAGELFAGRTACLALFTRGVLAAGAAARLIRCFFSVAGITILRRFVLSLCNSILSSTGSTAPNLPISSFIHRTSTITIMATERPFYSKKNTESPLVYHTQSACKEGQDIPYKEREEYNAYSEPRRRLCDKCEDLER